MLRDEYRRSTPRLVVNTEYGGVDTLLVLALRVPRPPLSTLFPYTTLFRSPPLAGFFSKEAVLAGVWDSGMTWPFLMLALTVLLTASMRNGDRKSTRLNSSHTVISYAVFCLKKKKEYATRRVPPLHPSLGGQHRVRRRRHPARSRLTRPAAAAVHTLSLHDALPISAARGLLLQGGGPRRRLGLGDDVAVPHAGADGAPDRQHEERRSEEHTSELQSHSDLVCRLLLEKKKRICYETSTAAPPLAWWSTPSTAASTPCSFSPYASRGRRCPHSFPTRRSSDLRRSRASSPRRRSSPASGTRG